MYRFLWLLLIVLFYKRVDTLICSRYPANTYTSKSPVDENYVISISGNPETYILGQEYNVSINAYNGRRYVGFILALENQNGDHMFHEDLGRFEVTDNVETRYSPNCVNMVESTNTNPKTHAHVTWIAPSEPGSGCILIRATLLQHRDVWHMDDGGLTRRLCEEIVDDIESRPISLDDSACCACDEARYELLFEGVWSRNLHPKYFPPRGWITRFGEIVGAAHTADYRFWAYDELATDGMKQYAEHGSAQLLEQEFSMNFKDGKIRTIIKARGPAFPNLNGRSVASVRVDPEHHLISLASKIDPSPDWIVGVSGLELCLPNCTWLDQKVINLYPTDIGSDAGPSYTSPDQPQVPPDVIRRMRSDFPNDPRSPFFDENGEPMKPMARLTINRQRLFERLCEDEESNNIDVPRECLTHPWSSWSECNAKCGEGSQTRSRVYKQPEVARIYKCESELDQERACLGKVCGDLTPALEEFGNQFETNQYSRAECQISQWGPWSACSRTCGEGKQTRRRQYINPAAEDKCQNARFMKLVEFRSCSGRTCLGEISNERFDDEINPDKFEPDYPNINSRRYNTDGLDNDRGQGRYNNEPQPPEYFEHNEDERLSYNRFRQEPIAKPNYYEQPIEDINTEANYEENPFEVGNLNKLNMDYGIAQHHQTQSRTKLRKPQIKFPKIRPLPAELNNDETDHLAAAPIGHLEDIEKSALQQTRPRRPENTYTQPLLNSNDRDETMPTLCFEPLRVVNCLDPTVTGNYWFYNHCRDECMLYAADACDRNSNRFNSLEECEQRCRQPAFKTYLRQRQNSVECKRAWTRHQPRNYANSHRTYQRYSI